MKKLNLKSGFLIVISVIGLCLPLFVSNPYTLQYFISMLLFGYLATSWNIIDGYAGQMANGNGVYFGIGAYVSTCLFTYNNLSPWAGMLIGGAISALVALGLGRLTFRLSGTYFTMATVACLHLIRLLVMSNQYLFGYEIRGAQGIVLPWKGESIINMQFTGKVEYYYIILAFFVIGVLVSYHIKTSKDGYYLSAINTNQEAASSLGVNVMHMKLKASCISAFMMAIGGTFYAQLYSMIDPSRVLGYDLSIQIMLYAAVGGRGTLAGPIIAAFLLSPLNDILRGTLGTTVSGLALVIYGLVMMLMVYFIPQGLWPFLRDKLSRAELKAQTAERK